MLGTMIRFLGIAVTIAVPLAAAGCGAAEGATGDDMEIGQVTQKFDESTCSTTAFDWDFGETDHDNHTSADANYNHTTCTHAYIGRFWPDYPGGGDYGFAMYEGPSVPPSWGCNGEWVQASLWKWTGSGNTFVHIATTTAYGYQNGNACMPPFAMVDVGDVSTWYKIIGRAGYATAYEPVQVGVSFH
jgi:hypothetical protein